MSISSHHTDKRIIVLLLLVVGMLVGLYVMNFQKQSSSAKAGLGCPAGEVPVPIKAGVNLCHPTKRRSQIVVNPGKVGALSTTFQCCIILGADLPGQEEEGSRSILAKVRDHDNAICRHMTGTSNAYCSSNQALQPKCEGSDKATKLKCSGLTAEGNGFSLRVCCIPQATKVTPTEIVPTVVVPPTLVPLESIPPVLFPTSEVE